MKYILTYCIYVLCLFSTHYYMYVYMILCDIWTMECCLKYDMNNIFWSILLYMYVLYCILHIFILKYIQGVAVSMVQTNRVCSWANLMKFKKKIIFYYSLAKKNSFNFFSYDYLFDLFQFY